MGARDGRMRTGSADRESLERLARRLCREHPELSFTRAKRVIEAGQVRVAGAVERDPGAFVASAVEVDFDPARPVLPAGEATASVEILHADDDVVVAVKPAGLLTQPTPADERDTLLSRVSRALAKPGGRRPWVGVVHRLDKETSGLVVFATSRRALATLQEQLLDRSLTRVYEAVVEGDLARDRGSFERALVGDGTHRRRWVAAPGERGKPAVTRWQVVARYGAATRVRAWLETGRTHQIRVHFAAAGHPVVGDRVYRRPDAPPFAIEFPRQALHAAELGFLHPADGRPMRFTAPRPADLERLLAALDRLAMERGRSVERPRDRPGIVREPGERAGRARRAQSRSKGAPKRRKPKEPSDGEPMA
jgi:23S rRNA pseudouridine1911/1915/1917 synthase